MTKDKKIIGIIIILIVVFIAIFAINLNKTNEGTVEQPNNQIESPTQKNLTEEELTNMVNNKFNEEKDNYSFVETSSDVLINNENWFTLRISMYESENSGEANYIFYNIDKAKGQLVNLSDLFKDKEYKSAISQEIKNQMQQKMKENSNLSYWIAQEGTDSIGFTSITDNQDFYISENGNIVVVFNKYEVAPGYMGVQEFEISKELYKDYLK